MYSKHSQTGFTLVELSIVIVILGLLTGGVLAGRSIIRAAELRSVLTETDEINRAGLMFRDKYFALPGDLPSTTANALGLTARNGADTRGDGDGAIENPIAWSGIVGGIGRESAFFWADVTKVGMLKGNFSSITDANIPQANLNTLDGYASYLPRAKAFSDGYYHIGLRRTDLAHYIVLGRPRGYNAWMGGVFYMNAIFTPEEALNLDAKLDDGLPANTGRVFFTNAGQASSGTFLPSPSGCVTSNEYNVLNPYGSEKVCNMFMEAAF